MEQQLSSAQLRQELVNEIDELLRVAAETPGFDENLNNIEGVTRVVNDVYQRLAYLDLTETDGPNIEIALGKANEELGRQNIAGALPPLEYVAKNLNGFAYNSQLQTFPTQTLGTPPTTARMPSPSGSPVRVPTSTSQVFGSPGAQYVPTSTSTTTPSFAGFGTGGFGTVMKTPRTEGISVGVTKVITDLPNITSSDLVDAAVFARTLGGLTQLVKERDISPKSMNAFKAFLSSNPVLYRANDGTDHNIFEGLLGKPVEYFTVANRTAIVTELKKVLLFQTSRSGTGPAVTEVSKFGKYIEEYTYKYVDQDDINKKQDRYEKNRKAGKKTAAKSPLETKKVEIKVINIVLANQPKITNEADEEQRRLELEDRNVFNSLVAQAYHKQNANVQARILSDLIESNDKVARTFGKLTGFRDGIAIGMAVEATAAADYIIVDPAEGTNSKRIIIKLEDYHAMVENAKILAKNMTYAGTLGRKAIKDEYSFKGQYKLVKLNNDFIRWASKEVFGIINNDTSCWVQLTESDEVQPREKKFLFQCVGPFWEGLRLKASEQYRIRTGKNSQVYLNATAQGTFLSRGYAKLSTVRNLFYFARIFGLLAGVDDQGNLFPGDQNVNNVLNFNGDVADDGLLITVGTQVRTKYLTKDEKIAKQEQGDNSPKASYHATYAMLSYIPDELNKAIEKIGKGKGVITMNSLTIPTFAEIIKQLFEFDKVEIEDERLEQQVPGVTNADLRDFVNAEHKALKDYKDLVVAHVIKRARDNREYRAKEATKNK